MIALMFKWIQAIAFWTAAFAIGTASLAYGQDPSPPENQDHYISIDPEDCVLFIWEHGSARPHMVSADSGVFGFSSQGNLVDYIQVPKSKTDEFGPLPAPETGAAAKHFFQLELGPPNVTDGTVFYKSGQLTTANDNTDRQTENVKAMISCNDTGEAFKISYSKPAGAFDMPDWLVIPETFAAEKPALKTVQAPVISLQTVSAPPASIQTVVEPSPTVQLPPQAVVELSPPVQIAPQPVAALLVLEPETLAPTFEVQLAAFRREYKVFEHLILLRETVPYIDEHRPETRTAEVEDLGLFHRLRLTGLPDRSSAISLCQRLKNDGVECFVP